MSDSITTVKAHHLEGDNLPGMWISDAVLEALWPWIPGHIDIYNDFDIDFNQHRFTVEAFGPGRTWLLRESVRIDRDNMLDGGTRWLAKACRELFDKFRYRPTFPVPDNIHLGEE